MRGGPRAEPSPMVPHRTASAKQKLHDVPLARATFPGRAFMTEDVFGIVGTVQGGAFRVDAVVAEGGFAVVYRAHHAAFRANVALKCLKVPGSMSKEAQRDFLEKFREEAELLFRLSSAIPSVVRPLQVGTLQEKDNRFVPFIALEWLEGHTLDKLVSTRAIEGVPPLDLRAAVKLLTPVADALYRAHRFPTPEGGVVSIIHRDLKPENVFIARISGRDVAKILDFGIAKAKSAATQLVGHQSANESPLSAFTPAYGAPEQWVPKRYGQTGPWTDVWGLALTVVEAICGHAPIDGDHAAMMGSAIDPARRPTPRNEGVKVTDEVESIFAHALAVDPRDRFHDVGTFWNALCRAVGLPETVGDEPRSLPPAPPAPEAPARARAMQPTEVAPPASVAEPVRSKAVRIDAESDFGLRPGRSVQARPRIGSAVGYGTTGRRESKLDIGGPVKLCAFAVALMAFDWGYSSFTGEVLRLGPARMVWLAGPLAVLGAIQLLTRLLAHGE